LLIPSLSFSLVDLNLIAPVFILNIEYEKLVVTLCFPPFAVEGISIRFSIFALYLHLSLFCMYNGRKTGVYCSRRRRIDQESNNIVTTRNSIDTIRTQLKK
jgi:hypothetical protein